MWKTNSGEINQHVSHVHYRTEKTMLFILFYTSLYLKFSAICRYFMLFFVIMIYLYTLSPFFPLITGKHFKVFNVYLLSVSLQMYYYFVCLYFKSFQCYFYAFNTLLLYAHWIYFSNCSLVSHNVHSLHFKYLSGMDIHIASNNPNTIKNNPAKTIFTNVPLWNDRMGIFNLGTAIMPFRMVAPIYIPKVL